jgi:hypothetical protein
MSSRDRGDDEQSECEERDNGTHQVTVEPARPEPLDVRGCQARSRIDEATLNGNETSP